MALQQAWWLALAYKWHLRTVIIPWPVTYAFDSSPWEVEADRQTSEFGASLAT